MQNLQNDLPCKEKSSLRSGGLEVAENKIEVGNFCAANEMTVFDKIRNILSRLFGAVSSLSVSHMTTTFDFTKMSSAVKRRKVDSDVPSELLRKKEKKEKRQKSTTSTAQAVSNTAEVEEEEVASKSQSPDKQEDDAAEIEEDGGVEEAPKTFKDLVRIKLTRRLSLLTKSGHN